MVFRICVWRLALCLYLATITVISKKVRQDESRLDVLKRLNENTVLVVNDWAMKFLPQLYRESQQDCFVKRGISWHISVVFRRVRGELQSQGFVHIIQQCNQDSTCIILIMQHVLKTLKAEHPEITTAFYRQDNAGCYHCANTILACPFIRKSTGIQVSRLDLRSVDLQSKQPARLLRHRETSINLVGGRRKHLVSFYSPGLSILFIKKFFHFRRLKFLRGAKSVVSYCTSVQIACPWPCVNIQPLLVVHVEPVQKIQLM